MLCTHVLGSVLVALTFIDHFATTSPVEATYKESNVKSREKIQAIEVQQCSPVPVGDRASNLKYVLVIKSLFIWQSIRKRTLTIQTQPEIGKILEKLPENWTDNELAELRQTCQDGLKCVSVDELIKLKTVLKSPDNVEISVKKVIINITKVLTEFTTECHPDVHKYAVIKDSDDMNKVNEVVNTIVDDNRVLCQIDVNGATGENGTKNDDTANAKVSNGITNGTTDETPDNGSSQPRLIDTDGVNAVVRNKNTDSIDSPPNSTYKTSPADVATERDLLYDFNNTASDHNTSRKTNDSNITNASMDTNKTSGTDEFYNNNFVDIGDDGNGNNDIYTDIASSGSHNKNVTCKGVVENGIINNNKMNVYSVNNGVINEATIHQANGSRGIINVGTVNNGDTNYGNVNSRTNNGNVVVSNKFHTKQYLASISDIYSTMLTQFANV